MVSKHRLAEVAALLADPSRAAMLGALMDGRALPAGDLARVAGVTAATASAHLKRLASLGLVRVQACGRHRYVRLAGSDVAVALEALERLVRTRPARSERTPEQSALAGARLCYDHLAGALGVAVTQALLERDGLVRGRRTAPVLARLGLGLDLGVLARGPRPLLRTCIDWTERREHVAGALGEALANAFLERDWVRRRRGTRAPLVTGAGRRALRERFGVSWA
jgi:DNA-binding transcriptional ArsR family regulator